ncbi:MAG: sugar phosphate isomerase/epimerase [Bacteroidales bacterium]|jgi:sugar phosphate isomerase/epimerase|nr:sugar phosphate isomerase/epimerase [Bacteroidales bacterium]
MANLSRRKFIKTGVAAAGAAFIVSESFNELAAMPAPKKVRMSPGFQVWTLRERLIKDFPGTLRMMSDLGYESVEMCSPPGYESSGFGPLMKYSGREMKQIINDAGLILESTHYQMGELRSNLDERIDFALESGQKQMIVSSFGLPRNATLGDWLKAAGEMNEMGMKTKQAGIQLGFHNHNTEFSQLEGKLIYDELIRIFDPEYVKMQFQVAVIEVGYKAADYFRKYPGRFISAHLADWSPEKKAMVPLGKGSVDWNEFFGAIKTGGVKNIFVEMDPSTFEESVKFIKSFSYGKK